MKTLYTNNGISSLNLRINEKTIEVFSIPNELKKRELMIIIKNSNGDEVEKKIFAEQEPMMFNLSTFEDGTYSFHLLFISDDAKCFWTYLSLSGISIKIINSTISFDIPQIVLSNALRYDKILKRFSRENLLKSSSKFQSKHPNISELVHEITRRELFLYSKVKAIHDWIATNISYDYDSIMDASYMKIDQSALHVLTTRKGVCQGFSNLCIAMLRAIGVPSMEIPCFALNITSEGGWEKENNLNQPANHVITAAYVHDRWILMDVTWDSDNVIKGGVKQARTNFGTKHLYFDVTIPFISNTHHITMI